MKKLIFLIFLAGCLDSGTMAQSGNSNNQLALKNVQILPKMGMEQKFEAAVLSFNRKFSEDGQCIAKLRRMEFGRNAGWYTWVLGPVAYSSLNICLAKEGSYKQEWNATIDPLIEEYGETNFYNLDLDLSFGLELLKKSKYYEVWSVDLKPGQENPFRELAGKLKKVYESENRIAFLVFENNIHRKDGPDVLMLWTFNNYDEWRKDPGPRATYEKLFGAGTWKSALEEWNNMIVDYETDIRLMID